MSVAIALTCFGIFLVGVLLGYCIAPVSEGDSR